MYVYILEGKRNGFRIQLYARCCVSSCIVSYGSEMTASNDDETKSFTSSPFFY